MASDCLVLNNVSITLKEPLLQNIHLSLKEGEILGIVGPSGCGKSMLLKSLLGLLPHGAHIFGEIHFFSTSLLSLTEKQWQKIRGKQIGIIFQDPFSSLNPTMTIGRQLIEMCTWHLPHLSYEDAKQHVLFFLEKVQLDHPEQRFHQYPFELSGGQCQRVCIALALIPKPKILLADEPTTALDRPIQKQILDLLEALQSDLKMSIIFVTHNMTLIKGFSHRIATFHEKTLLFSEAKELVHAP